MNKNKMTCAEFKKAFNDAGYNFDVWGFEGILNMIACLENRTAIEMAQAGCIHSANESEKRSQNICIILSERGYYSTK